MNLSASNPVAWFLGRIRHYMSGKGNPLTLIVGWWALLNAVSFYLGMIWAAHFDHPENFNILERIISFSMGTLGFIIAFVYPFILIVSVWTCAFNLSPRWAGYVIRLLIIPIMVAQMILCIYYFIGAIAFITAAFA